MLAGMTPKNKNPKIDALRSLPQGSLRKIGLGLREKFGIIIAWFYYNLCQALIPYAEIKAI